MGVGGSGRVLALGIPIVAVGAVPDLGSWGWGWGLGLWVGVGVWAWVGVWVGGTPR